MTTTLFGTFAIEFGFLQDRRQSREVERETADALAGVIDHEMRSAMKTPKGSCDGDGGAIEISTPPLQSRAEAYRFYRRMMTIVARYPLVTHRPDTYSGGGHIHFGLKRVERPYQFDFLRNLFIDITNRPYLNWMFNEFHDVGSAESLVFCRDVRERLFVTTSNVWGLQVFSCPKGFAVRADPQTEWGHDIDFKRSTVEFRFFDAKRSWRETRDHVDFMNAYLWYILKITMLGAPVKQKVKCRRDILAKVPKAVDEFREFVQTLGLEWSRYRYYVALNFKPRVRYGAFCHHRKNM